MITRAFDTRVELFECHRRPGWCALVWERQAKQDYIRRAVFAPTAGEADLAARGWVEQLRQDPLPELWP